MERSELVKMWGEAWDSAGYFAPWRKALAGLSAEQAAWSPRAEGVASGLRHSIWQNVNHVSIWREYVLKKMDAARAGPTREEVNARNFESPERVDEVAWTAAVARLKRSHDDLRAAIERGTWTEADALRHHTHDCYHLGQVMYVRAMLGLAPIE